MTTTKSDKTRNLGKISAAAIGSIVTGVVIIAFFFMAAPAINRQSFARIEAGPIKIEFDHDARIAKPTQKIVDTLSKLTQTQREFLLAHDEFDYDAVCLDQRSVNPADNAEDQAAQHDRAVLWTELTHLELADVRPARTPYAWCSAGQTQTFHITVLGQETRDFLVDVIFKTLKIDAP